MRRPFLLTAIVLAIVASPTLGLAVANPARFTEVTSIPAQGQDREITGILGEVTCTQGVTYTGKATAQGSSGTYFAEKVGGTCEGTAAQWNILSAHSFFAVHCDSTFKLQGRLNFSDGTSLRVPNLNVVLHC